MEISSSYPISPRATGTVGTLRERVDRNATSGDQSSEDGVVGRGYSPRTRQSLANAATRLQPDIDPRSRSALDAYLSVASTRSADSSLGELVGLDLYV